MRIAHLVSTFPPYFGGMGNAVFGMAKESVKHGHEVTVLTLGQKNQESRIKDQDGVVVRRLRPLIRLGNAGFVPQLFWTLDDFDLVHLHYPFFGGQEATALWRASYARGKKKPFVMTYHMDAIASGWRGRFFDWETRHVLPKLLAMSDRVVVTTKDYALHSALTPHDTLIAGKMVEIPLGVDTERFCPGTQDNAIRTSFAVAPDASVLLFVGGLDTAHAFKGVEPLLRAFALYAELQGSSCPQVLVIVGDGDRRPIYEALAIELKIADRVRFVGRVSDADLPDYYRASDCCILPSTSSSEAFGMVVLEAMACARPVIASALPGVRTLIEDGISGFLVRPDDVVALAKMFDRAFADPKRLVAMGEEGRKSIEEKYTWEKVGDLVSGVYDMIGQK